MMKITMKAVDLGELYALLEMYGRVYGGVPKELMEGVETAYGEAEKQKGKYRGKETIRNPRGAGRTSTVTEEQIEQAVQLYQNGYKIRDIAKEMGYSVGYVHKLIHEHGR